MLPNIHQLDKHVSQLVAAALKAVEPGSVVRKHLSWQKEALLIGSQAVQLNDGKLYLLSVGKASIPMAQAALDIAGSAVHQGIIITKQSALAAAEIDDLDPRLPKNIALYGADHPISNASSVTATSVATAMLQDLSENDVVLCLISGGTSSLLTEPRINLADWQALVDALLSSGCTINELNAVRKRLDRVKGGGLARIASPARCYSLILSDVVGNPLDIIGSGPTVEDPDPPMLARQVLDRYGVKNRLKSDSWTAIETQLQIAEAETESPKINASNLVVGDVRLAAEAAAAAASKLGFEPTVLTCHLEGEAREIGKVAAAIAKDASGNSCTILAGETTVTVQGDGLGGRNQELALSAAITLDGWPNSAVISFATDGEDGRTPAAGAFVTGESASNARRRRINPLLYLDRNDAYHFFKQAGGLIDTGPTGTNVNDLIVILKYRHQ